MARKSARWRLSCSADSVPRARPNARARQARTASWQVKALVEATPISGPASVRALTSRLARHGRGADVDDADDGLALGLGVAQRCQRVGRLARLRDHDRDAVAAHRRLAIAELGRDVDVDRYPGDALEPVFRRQARDIGGAAGHDGDAVDPGGIEGQFEGQRDAAGRQVDVMGQRAAHHLGLLVDLLRHEVAIVALVDHEGGGEALLLRPRHAAVRLVVELDRVAPAGRPSRRRRDRRSPP